MDCIIENDPVFTILRVVLSEGESFRAEPGAMISMTPTIEIKAQSSGKGLFSTLASGEGLVGEYKGPGKLWIQSRNLKGFAQLINSLVPKRS